MVDHKDTLISDQVIADPDHVRDILAQRVREVLRATRGKSDRHIERLVVRIPTGNPFSWLRAQQHFPRIYWQGRDDDFVTAAVGSADVCFGGRGADYADLRRQLDAVLPISDVRVRYFGGFRFDRNRAASPEWESFGTFTFVLPRFEFLASPDGAVLACNLILPRDAERVDDIQKEIASLRFVGEEPGGSVPTPISRVDVPDADGWKRNVQWSLDAFRSDELQKIVLARRVQFGFAEPVNALMLLEALEAATDNCFVFGFQFAEDGAFVGATPERLFRRDGRRIWTEAVAGTRPRGSTPQEDEERLRSLMESDKDQREHTYVRVSIRDALAPLCSNFHIEDEASAMKLPRNWHLVSRCQGTVLPGVHGSDVMRALHPTPAVGGHPTETAIEAIRALEPFDRGWYTGPVGWIGAQAAEFAVALRCGLVRDTELSLYSGAGIVEGSNPDSEWAEIEQKLGDFIKVLDLEYRG